MYKEVFERAENGLGMRTIFVLTDPNKVPASWNGEIGRLVPDVIRTSVPDYRNSIFYISGSRAVVEALKGTLRSLHASNSQIKTDYFAGLA